MKKQRLIRDDVFLKSDAVFVMSFYYNQTRGEKSHAVTVSNTQ